jgi:hypothetical protein
VVLHKCTTIRHAHSAVKLGVDFLSIDGFECAGHVGESDITNFILLSRARQSLKVPFIASGGFADGQGLAAALALGAEGINMGTRFMCTVEAPIHVNIKRAIVDAQETDTELVLRKWRNTSRLFSNKIAKDAVKLERVTDKEFGDSGIASLVSGKRGRQVFLNGDVDFGVRLSMMCRRLLIGLGLDGWAGHRPDSRYPDVRGFAEEDREGGGRVVGADGQSLAAGRKAIDSSTPINVSRHLFSTLTKAVWMFLTTPAIKLGGRY